MEFFLLSFHSLKFQLNSFAIFSQTQTSSRLNPDNEAHPYLKFFNIFFENSLSSRSFPPTKFR
jgi:hypothetical protein